MQEQTLQQLVDCAPENPAICHHALPRQTGPDAMGHARRAKPVQASHAPTSAKYKSRARCGQCAMAAQCILRPCAPEELDGIATDIDDVEFGTHQTLYQAGAREDHVFVLRTHPVALHRIDIDGQDRISWVARRGDVIGLESLIDQPNQHAASPLHTARVCRIPRDRLNPAVIGLDTYADLLAHWSTAVRRVDDAVCLYGLQRGLLMRIALLLLALTDTEEGETLVMPPLDDLAALVGARMESVSRCVAGLHRTTANSSMPCSGFFAPVHRGEACRPRMVGGKTPIDVFAVGVTRAFGSRCWSSSLWSLISNGS